MLKVIQLNHFQHTYIAGLEVEPEVYCEFPLQRADGSEQVLLSGMPALLSPV